MLTLLPPLLMGLPNNNSNYQLNERMAEGGSYHKVMWAIFFMHLVQFLLNSQIYGLKHEDEENDDDYFNYESQPTINSPR